MSLWKRPERIDGADYYVVPEDRSTGWTWIPQLDGGTYNPKPDLTSDRLDMPPAAEPHRPSSTPAPRDTEPPPTEQGATGMPTDRDFEREARRYERGARKAARSGAEVSANNLETTAEKLREQAKTAPQSDLDPRFLQSIRDLWDAFLERLFKGWGFDGTTQWAPNRPNSPRNIEKRVKARRNAPQEPAPAGVPLTAGAGWCTCGGKAPHSHPDERKEYKWPRPRAKAQTSPTSSTN